ncbi:MAG: Na+/H+ antiporter NhaC family protein, partial [Bacteroidales bacterium]
MKRANLLLSTLPLVILIATLFAAVKWFGGDITSGPSQIALLIATLTTLLISTLYLKVPWSTIERAMIENLSQTGSAIFILLMIGAITASWMISGVVPTMIYYGLKVITPSLFLVVAFLLSGAVSVMSGSSWTTVGTIGVALLTAGEIIGFPSPWLAGAVISGAYLGDKISPLS